MENWGEVLAALLTWLLAQCGLCLFFFSFAAFCAMFTGHILALPAFYGILNGLAAGLWFLVDALMNEFFYGYAGTRGALTVVEYLTPAEALTQAVRWWTEDGLSSPGVVAGYAVVGVGLALVSLYVYRRRHVETAGDVVAVAVVRPLFKYGVSFCSGLAFGMFTAAFFGWSDLPVLIPCILVWTVVGCFAAEMLLKKSFRVLKAWRGAAVMAAVVLALCLVCLMDVFGVVNRVPAAARVQSVHVEIDMGYPYDGGRTLSADFTDVVQIEKVLALHRAIVDCREAEGRGFDSESDYTSAYFTYTLSGGGKLDRRYRSVPICAEDLDTKGTVAYALSQIAGDRELAAIAYDFDGFLKDARLTSAYLDRVYLDERAYSETLYLDDYRQELWDAVQRDFAVGNIGARYLFDNDRVRRENTYQTDLIFEVSGDRGEAAGPASNGEVYYETRSSNRYLAITLSPNARNTLAVLEKAGVFEEGYSLIPWDTGYDPRYPDTVAGGEGEIIY
jgi:ABC-2 type transport system permease protein